jgi:hypothetical protein
VNVCGMKSGSEPLLITSALREPGVLEIRGDTENPEIVLRIISKESLYI